MRPGKARRRRRRRQLADTFRIAARWFCGRQSSYADLRAHGRRLRHPVTWDAGTRYVTATRATIVAAGLWVSA